MPLSHRSNLLFYYCSRRRRHCPRSTKCSPNGTRQLRTLPCSFEDCKITSYLESIVGLLCVNRVSFRINFPTSKMIKINKRTKSTLLSTLFFFFIKSKTRFRQIARKMERYGSSGITYHAIRVWTREIDMRGRSTNKKTV